MKKIFYIMTAILILIILSIFDSSYFIAVNTEFNQTNKEIPVGELINGMEVGQTFIAKEDNLSRIGITLATYARENDKEIEFGIREYGQKQNIKTIKFFAEDVEDNKIKEFKFMPILDSKGKKYYFYLKSQDSFSGNAITIWKTSGDSFEKGEIYVNNSKDTGDLTFVSGYMNTRETVLNTFYFLLIYIFIVVMIYLIIFKNNKIKNITLKVFTTCNEKRFLICGMLFFILVLGKFHGSSISIWDSVFKDNITSSGNTLLIGKERAIRSDEWLVQTPYALSQAMNEKFYPIINNDIRSNGQNMLVSYFVPVFDFTLIGKPFNWGYILFGKEYGLSWFWFSRLIALWLVSYELISIFTNNNRKLSFFGAFWITFSPPIQWWFSTFVIDLIIYGQAIMACFYNVIKYINHFRNKVLNLIILIIALIGYIVTLYPAVQVPLGYVIAIFVFYFSFENRKNVKLKKNDMVLILLSLAIIITIIGKFLYDSLDAIKIIMNTTYPGKRVSLGGGYEFKLFQTFLINPILPYKDITFSNNCEISAFIGFNMFIAMSFIFYYKKYRGNYKKLYLSLYIYFIFQISWLFIKYPYAFAKITLFSFVPEPRMIIILGLNSIYLSLWILNQKIQLNKKYWVPVLIFVGSVTLYSLMDSRILEYIGIRLVAIITIIYLLLNYLLATQRRNIFIIIMSLIILVSGASINPIGRGLESIYNKKISKEILKINTNKKEENWISLDSIFFGNYLLAHGVKCINSVNFYPDMHRWEKLDKDKRYEDIYNRYAHINIKLTQDDTYFTLEQPDMFTVYINYEDLKTLQVKYILTKENLLKDKNIERYYTLVKEYYNEADNIYIWSIHY
ncbi:hypothetical protein QBE52_02605 [Clostridiaceae bacterium 35-E11]